MDSYGCAHPRPAQSLVLPPPGGIVHNSSNSSGTPTTGGELLPPIPTLVSCPKCSQHFTLYTAVSGNTFGATYWTDGWIAAPMLPPDRDVVVCPYCQQPVWAQDCKAVEPARKRNDEYAWMNDEQEHDPYERCKGFEVAHAADLEEWKSLLHPLPEDPDRERYLRTRIWWRMNDRRRDSDVETPPDDEEVINMITLAAILIESEPSDLVMKAEIMRELGRFRLAAALIRRVRQKTAPVEAPFIRELIEKGDVRVRRIDTPEGGEIRIYA